MRRARVPSLEAFLAGRRRRTVRARTVFTTRWFSIEQVPYKPRQPYYRVSCGDSVGILAMTAREEMVLVRQYRPAVGIYMTEWPAGEVGPGESPACAVVRELGEETGYACQQVTYLGSRLAEPARYNHVVHWFFGEGARQRARRQREAAIGVTLVRADQFGRFVLECGERLAAPTVGIYYLAHLRGFV